MKYAGIGSRNVPQTMRDDINKIAAKLAEQGYLLRSGGASGCDVYFEEGCDSVGGSKEIYIPWKGFNKSTSELHTYTKYQTDVTTEFTKKYHPNWTRLGSVAMKMMGRNVMQVLGANLDDPVDFVICWTPDGAEKKTTRASGGTGQAIRIAVDLGIPVYNLHNMASHMIVNDIINGER